MHVGTRWDGASFNWQLRRNPIFLIAKNSELSEQNPFFRARIAGQRGRFVIVTLCHFQKITMKGDPVSRANISTAARSSTGDDKLYE